MTSSAATQEIAQLQATDTVTAGDTHIHTLMIHDRRHVVSQPDVACELG